MKKLIFSFAFLFSFFVFSTSNPTLLRDTFIKINLNEIKRIQDLHEGNEVLSLEMVTKQAIVLKLVKIKKIEKIITKELVKITTNIGALIVGVDTKFYNPESNEWIVAKNLTTKDKLFNLIQGCLSIEQIDLLNLDEPTELYEILIEAPHVYFIQDSNGNLILVHNNLGNAVNLALEYIVAGGENSNAIARAVPWVAPVLAPIILAAGAANALKGKMEANTSKNKNDEINKKRNNVQFDDETLIDLNSTYDKDFVNKIPWGKNISESQKKVCVWGAFCELLKGQVIILNNSDTQTSPDDSEKINAISIKSDSSSVPPNDPKDPKNKKDKDEDKKNDDREQKTIKTNINELEGNKINHIKQPKHCWNKLVKDENWRKIKNIIEEVMNTGTERPRGVAKVKTKIINDEVVEVTYQFIDGINKISNAWVK
ncbi:MAG: hypothetical protein JXA94_00390 [Parachlamydiales bacterium]|nr:hypothetical protein [Parachlamydiales bacterium]